MAGPSVGRSESAPVTAADANYRSPRRSSTSAYPMVPRPHFS